MSIRTRSTSPFFAVRSAIAALCAGLAVVSLSIEASASQTKPLQTGRGMKFGADPDIRKIRDLSLKSNKSEALHLAHKVTFHWFWLPYKVTDDGYVLAVSGSAKHYTLDRSAMVSLQAQGRLPTPLPEYRLSYADYFTGNILWIALALTAAWHICRHGHKLLPRSRLPRLPMLATARAGLSRLAELTASLPLPSALRAAVRPTNLYAADIFAPAVAPSRAAAAPAPHTQFSNVTRLPVARVVCRVKSLKAA